MPRQTRDQNPAWIGLGSNLGDSRAILSAAIGQLADHPECNLEAVSPCYRSQAIGPGEQRDYLNAVLRVSTSLSATALLDLLQSIEQHHGRQRELHWGPRTLDLDLLLFNQLIVKSPNLVLPHPRLAERNFVVYPLMDLEPGMRLPDGRSLAAIHRKLDDCGLQRLSHFSF